MTQSDDATLGITNPELSAALERLAEDDSAQNRQAFYDALLLSTLILPTPEIDEASAEASPDFLGEDEALTFVTFENDTGGIVMIAFTDEDAALTWEPEGLPYLGLRGMDLLLIAAENEVDEIVINPASPSNYRIGNAEIVALTRGEAPEPTPPAPPDSTSGTTILVGQPEETPPRSWREALAEILEHYPSVEAAYYFQLHIPPEGGRNVIGLELYEGMSDDARSRMMDTLLKELEEHLPRDQSLDIVVLDDPNFLRTVADTVSPIYPT